MEVRLGIRAGAAPGASIPRGHVSLHPDNGLEIVSPGQLLECPGSVEVAMIRDGQRRLLELDSPPNEVFESVGAVEQRILGMAMEVDERHFLTIRQP
jgi:hypothetical protein